MWNYIKLSRSEFADLVALLNTLKTDIEKFRAVAQSGVHVLIVSRSLEGGRRHQVMFSPSTFEILSEIDENFFAFKVDPIGPPRRIGNMDGFVFLFGDKLFYEFVKSKSQMSLFE
jgi:hypothetical protein